MLFTDPCVHDAELLVDTGSTITLVPRHWEGSFDGLRNSSMRAECANGTDIEGRCTGQLQLMVSNDAGQPVLEVLAHSSESVPTPLLTLDDQVCNRGMQVHLAKTGSRMYNKEYDVPFHYDEGRGGWWLQAKLVPPGCGMTVDTAKLLRRRQECYAAYRKQCSSPYTPTANKLMNAIRALHRGPNRISSVEAVTDNVFANMKKEAGA